MPRLSQRDRLNAALSDFRMAHAQASTSPLDAPKRSAFVKALLAERWTRRQFTQTRYGIRLSWRGDKLTALHELSYYLLPRALWAQPREGRESWVRRETVWTLVALVQHKLGREAATKLRKALTANGVKYRPRRIMTAAQKQALKARAFGKKPIVPTKVTTTVARQRRRISFDDE